MGALVATDAAKTAIPGLELVAELGRGTTTAVYRGVRLGEQYAVKVKALSGPNDPARLAFRREAAILAAIQHRCLAKVYELGDDGVFAYLVMELIEGLTLADVLAKEGHLEESRAVAIALDLASALEAAHRVGLVHRDVAPRNVVIRPDGSAVLIDFGLATQTGASLPDSTVVGTVLYSAPEQTGMMRRPVDRRSDLYSLGGVLFHTLAGTPPFAAEDAGELVRLHAVAAHPDLRTLRPDISPELARVVDRLLAKDPDDRYQDASAVIDDLAALGDGSFGEEDPRLTARYSALVGRSDKLATLEAWVAETARTGSGGAVLVSSEPGGGKSRVLAEMVRGVRAEGHLVLEARFGPDHEIPLRPIARAVGRFLADLEARRPDKLAIVVERLRLTSPRVSDSLYGLAPELDRFLSPGGSESSWHGFAVVEVAHLLLALATASDGAVVLVLDGAERADDGTHRALAYLAPELQRLPLLVVLAAREDARSGASLSRLSGELGDALIRRIDLPPLSDVEVAELLRRQLGGSALEEQLQADIIVRANGNPAAAVEFLRAALEAGVLRPSWGRFFVDGAALASLALPGDVLGLCLGRLESLGEATRWSLSHAAVIGSSFSPELVAPLVHWPTNDVHVALGEAARARVVEQEEAGRYRFVHEGLREALLAKLPPGALRKAHEALAHAFEQGGDGRAETAYEVARHLARGQVATDPARAFRANHRAGRLALAAQADEDALFFLETAFSIAETNRLPLGSAFNGDYAAALARCARDTDALKRYEVALELEREPANRATLLEASARLHASRGDATRCAEEARLGLEALGRPLPKSPLMLYATAPWRLLVALGVMLTRIGFGRSKARERNRLECRLLELAGEAASREHRFAREMAMALRAMGPASRLGRSPEYVTTFSKIARLFADAHFVESARLTARHVRKVAEAAGDPFSAVQARLVLGIIEEYRGDSVRSEGLLATSLTQDARLLDPQQRAAATAQLCLGLGLRGRLIEEHSFLEAALGAPEVVGGEGSGLEFAAVGLAGFLGRASAGLDRIARLEAERDGTVSSRLALARFDMALASFHFGLGDVGLPFDEAVTAFRSSLAPWRCPHSLAAFWPVQAHGRVAQLFTASPEDVRTARRRARRAVRDLRVAARTPVLRAYHCSARAGYLVAVGRASRAVAVADRGRALLVGRDAPGAEAALAMVRARALSVAGHHEEAERAAMATAVIAEDLELRAFVRWCQPDLPQLEAGYRRYVNQVSSLSRRPRPRDLGGSDNAGSLQGSTRAARQLEALFRVGAAAARVLDPEELIRLALDETARILNAERALLFLVSEPSGAVRPHIGRDAAGGDLTTFTGYSTTLVDRVATRREPLVLTGTEEGAALGAESAVVHGLRSILVAPLLMEDRLLGVVYLDSRLAKGIFTHEDLEILSAITSHVAFALETVRLAEMEVSVATERREREVAELLRDSMRMLGQSLDPPGVLRTMLQSSVHALAGDAGAVLLAAGERLQVAGVIGPGVTLPPEGYDVARIDEPAIAAALRARGPRAVGAVLSEQASPLYGLLGRSASYVVAPLVVRDEAIGTLVVTSKRSDVFGDTQTKIVAALASQGVVAYENAQLFTKVQALAEKDELSGVSNRRHFFNLAATAFAGAREARAPLSAMMLDIDHFKEVNDHYGHAAGDDVIRAVAARIDAVLGSGDLLGRYGGEEFALVVPGSLEAAAELAERLRRVISDAPITTAGGPVTVTASVGVAELSERDSDLGRLLQRTDAALYAAKRAGRDRVEVSS